MAARRAPISTSLKNSIAACQKHRCAGVPDYACPLGGNTFDESGFHIDHKSELADGGDNSVSNLQALCPCCHSVKTQRASRARKAKTRKKPAADKGSTGLTEKAVLEALVGDMSEEHASAALRDLTGDANGIRLFCAKHGIAYTEALIEADGGKTFRISDLHKLFTALKVDNFTKTAAVSRKELEKSLVSILSMDGMKSHEVVPGIPTVDFILQKGIRHRRIERRTLGGGRIDEYTSVDIDEFASKLPVWVYVQ